MVKPDIQIKDLKKFNIWASFILGYISVGSLIAIVVFVSITIAISNVYNTYTKAINNGGYDLVMVCKMLSCSNLTIVDENTNFYASYIADHDKELNNTGNGYVRDLPNKERVRIFGNITTSLDIVLKTNYGTIIVDSGVYRETMANIAVLFTLIFFVPYTLLYSYIFLKRLKTSLIQKGEFKSELEVRLQRDLTEMLHHELGAPIAIIDSSIHEIAESILPCTHKSKDYCDLGNNNNNNNNNICKKCKIYIEKKEELEPKVELINNITLSLDRIKSILKTISNSKHIRFSNGTVPIFNICENIINSINSFKLHKLDVEYVNPDILKSNSVLRKLGNGNMLNILHVLCNNSIEAFADKVIFEAKLLDVNMLELKVSDNGNGILDKNGLPAKNNDIFRYGYSSKDTNNKYYRDGIIVKLLNLLGFEVSMDNKTTRGIGLFISRETIRKAGGDIILDHTSEEGTTFKLLIPIKKTKLYR